MARIILVGFYLIDLFANLPHDSGSNEMSLGNTSEAVREYQRKWRAKNPEKCAAYTKKYRAKDPEKHTQYRKRWMIENSEYVLNYHRVWRSANKEVVRAASKKWRNANPERQKSATSNWRKVNIVKVRENEVKRYASDPKYRIGKLLRSRIRWALFEQSTKKSARSLELTGCTIDFLMGHLEAQFRDGMDWNNYGRVWEIDHIRPCALFDLTDSAQQKSCFHYSNLQPLFSSENKRKHCKFELSVNS